MDYDDYVEDLCLDNVNYTQLSEVYDFDSDWESVDIKEFLNVF